jgi:tripeptide aminopeptidase
MGLPTPNIFTGGHNFHSRTEWLSVHHLEKTVETLVQLAQLYIE